MQQTISLAEQLKSDTADNHQKAESNLAPYIATLRSVDDYAGLLKMFYGFYAPLYKRIATFITSEQLPDFHERETSAFILRDLDALSVTEEIEMCHLLPQVNDIPSAFGALYVLEGSTLGGKYIRNMLLSNPDLHITENATGFFNSYGPNTGSKWKALLHSINQQPEHSRVISTANDTFEYFGSWINKTLHDQ